MEATITVSRYITDERGYTALFGEFPHKLSCSFSRPGVIRGLHFHTKPVTKTIRLLSGRIFDVLVNLYTGAWTGYDLASPHEIYCPSNYAHGFLALEPSIVLYEWNPYWDVESGGTIVPWDWKLNIPFEQFWKKDKFIISDKDRHGITLQEAQELLT